MRAYSTVFSPMRIDVFLAAFRGMAAVGQARAQAQSQATGSQSRCIQSGSGSSGASVTMVTSFCREPNWGVSTRLCQPKSPNPLVDPVGYAEEQKRLRAAYAAEPRV